MDDFDWDAWDAAAEDYVTSNGYGPYYADDYYGYDNGYEFFDDAAQGDSSGTAGPEIQRVDLGDGKYYVYDPSTGKAHTVDAEGNVDWSYAGGDSSASSDMWGKIGSGLGSLAQKAGIYDKNGNFDLAGALKAAAMAGVGGSALAGLLGSPAGQPQLNRGYQGSAKKFDVSRKRLDVPFDMPGLSGAKGKKYFEDVQYKMAAGGRVGGIASLKSGGVPRYVKGGTDGMADEVPATIDGKEPARIAHGEFIVPADVVSHLGNGNSDAGANVLYNMMDRVRKARTGTEKQGKQIDPNKFTPR